ncbi:MAG: DUF1016 N-terminal domain-containing protein [Cyanobacteria bacterium J06555_13]
MIEQSKTRVVTQVNQTLVLTYWHIGKAIKTTLITTDRAEYGKATVEQLGHRLSQEYGAGFGKRNLFRMIRFYEHFADVQIVTTVSAQLSWSHFVELIRLDDTIKREFYATMCANENWSVRTLRNRMQGMLFERTAIAKQPDQVIRQELSQLAQQKPASPQLALSVTGQAVSCDRPSPSQNQLHTRLSVRTTRQVIVISYQGFLT